MLNKRPKDAEDPRSETRPVVRGGDLTIIAQDMRIVGNCETAGSVRLDGSITGTVRAGSLDLTASGSVEGDVVSFTGGTGDEVFVVSGRVGGAVRAGRVEVRRGGSVVGGLVVREATIQGRVQGGILARDRLALEETAVVEGDVRARRLALKEGGQVNGNIRMGEEAVVEPLSGTPAPVSPTSSHDPSAQPGEGPVLAPRLLRPEDAQGVDAGGLTGGEEGGRKRYG